jgi:hypothetical protein
MLKHGMITKEAIDTVYAPLSWIGEHFQFFAKAVNAYVRLWVGDWTPLQ